MNYFNFRNYMTLLESVTKGAQTGEERDQSSLDLIKRASDTFLEYVRSVDYSETRICILRFRANSSEEFRDLVTEIDRSRRNSHESCIMFCRILNRQAHSRGIGPVFEGDLEQREQVTQFCIEFVAEVYNSAHEEMKNREEP